MTDHQEIILARMGEITLKGLNRGKFERQLIGNIKRRLQKNGRFLIEQRQSRLWIEPVSDDTDIRAVLEPVASIFGIVSVSPVWQFDGEMPELLDQAKAYVGRLLADGKNKSFKVESRRGNKQFPLKSPEISAQVGEHLARSFEQQLSVDIHHPDLTLYVEVRDHIYLYHEIVIGQKGLPVGTGGKGMLLLSGGIDSPVAGYQMASRGMELDAVYFHTFPFTSDQAKEKVIDLGRLLTQSCGRLTLHVVDFTDIQLKIRDHCPEDMMTIVMRRIMMRIADQLATRTGCKALITGESLGQVASQTLEALCTTDTVVEKPVFRPLIGTDKDSVIATARRIGTYETSILPYEDCCTVFVAKHPKTHPSLDDAVTAESELDIDQLVLDGLGKIEEINL